MLLAHQGPYPFISLPPTLRHPHSLKKRAHLDQSSVAQPQHRCATLLRRIASAVCPCHSYPLPPIQQPAKPRSHRAPFFASPLMPRQRKAAPWHPARCRHPRRSTPRTQLRRSPTGCAGRRHGNQQRRRRHQRRHWR